MTAWRGKGCLSWYLLASDLPPMRPKGLSGMLQCLSAKLPKHQEGANWRAYQLNIGII